MFHGKRLVIKIKTAQDNSSIKLQIFTWYGLQDYEIKRVFQYFYCNTGILTWWTIVDKKTFSENIPVWRIKNIFSDYSGFIRNSSTRFLFEILVYSSLFLSLAIESTPILLNLKPMPIANCQYHVLFCSHHESWILWIMRTMGETDKESFLVITTWAPIQAVLLKETTQAHLQLRA